MSLLQTMTFAQLKVSAAPTPPFLSVTLKYSTTSIENGKRRCFFGLMNEEAEMKYRYARERNQVSALCLFLKIKSTQNERNLNCTILMFRKPFVNLIYVTGIFRVMGCRNKKMYNENRDKE